jgi:hypothetical protein
LTGATGDFYASFGGRKFSSPPTVIRDYPLVNDDTYTVALAELDGIANAAMTQSQREMRAKPVLAQTGLSSSDICSALAGERLGWNRRKASAYGVSVEDWLRALDVAGLNNCDSLGTLLGVIHRAESAAAMLRAGYRPMRGSGGALSWTR